MTDAEPLRESLDVGLIGYGALGSSLARLVCDQPNLRLGGVLALNCPDHPQAADDIETLIQRSDVIVEAAGPSALQAYASTILESGRTLIACSVGAFLQEGLWRLLTESPPTGRLILSTGALGGLDMARAVGLADAATTIALRTSKKPRALVQPWMDDAMVTRLQRLGADDAPVEVFSGQARDAARLFPANLNVAAALALAIGDPDRVSVTLSADPRAVRTTHHIDMESSLGVSSFAIQNRPMDTNPATSAVVPWAVLRCLRDLAASNSFHFA
jgi:aspartate dehydrogenase